MKNEYLRYINALFLYCLMAETATAARFQQPPLEATYNKPAKVWEGEALPIGNGYMGAMIFGGVEVDVIQTDGHTLWSGDPGEDPSYSGGHLGTPGMNESHLHKTRVLLQQKMNDFTADHSAYIDADRKLIAHSYKEDDNGTELRNLIDKLAGTKEHFDSFQTLDSIIVEVISSATSESVYPDYTRTLDTDNAIHRATYKEGEITFKRKYFMSYPGSIMVIRLTPDSKKGKISCMISLGSLHTDKVIQASDNTITLTGYPTPTSGDKRIGDHWKNGLKCAQQLLMKHTGGKVMVVGGKKLKIEEAKEIIVLVSAATNYVQCMDDSYHYFSGEEPLDKVKVTLKKAANKKYTALLATHERDYHSLYDRVKLNLGNLSEMPVTATGSLLKGMGAHASSEPENQYLEMLCFQFGRYLLISSSREGSLPANLQGVWGGRLSNPWNSDYHANINVQMNYWPTQPTNLSRCHLPMVEYVRSLIPRREYTAQQYYCKPDGGNVRGWVTHHENNIWDNTAPAKKDVPHHLPVGAIWMCQDIWEYYQFNLDKDFLEACYDVMLQVALFWVDNLWTGERDGTLMVNPSHSLEHGELSLGCSTSQAMIAEMFDMMIKASKVLDKDRKPEIAEIKTAMNKLSDPKIGLGGQLMGWRDEVTKDTTGDDGRKHTNHLFWLHSGSRIVVGRSEEDDKYVNVMKATLNTRGDESTGWGKAWELNSWARLHDGNRSHILLRNAMKLTVPQGRFGGVYTNLLDAHPPFQIDGNFGCTAGIAEMLMQSQGGYIELLLALPDTWEDDAFKRVKAKRNFEVDVAWKEGQITSIEALSSAGAEYMLKYPDVKSLRVPSAEVRVLVGGRIAFDTVKGRRYTIK